MTEISAAVPDQAVNGDGPEACMVLNSGYDFNDAILALGATYRVKLVETKLEMEALSG